MSNIEINKNPNVSVLMSFFNAAEWIKDSINSVLLQTFKDFEFIIIDDGSTDKSVDIVEKFCRMDKRIVLIKKEHTGLANSLNIGIDTAKGKWIARIDADDICELDRLERQFNFSLSKEGLVFIGTNCVELNTESNHKKVTQYPVSNDLLLKYLQTARKFPPHSSAFFLKSAAISVGRYRHRFKRAQDRDLWLRISRVGNIACLDKVLVVIRKHDKQISKKSIDMHQLLYSYMAMTSYYVQKSNLSDPIDGTRSEYLEFKQWLLSKLELNGVIDRINIMDNFNSKEFIGSPFKLKVLVNLLIIFKNRFFGSKLPLRLSKDWKIYKSKS
jgi:glycosyltransferase involved in cell wall biosynthesis